MYAELGSPQTGSGVARASPLFSRRMNGFRLCLLPWSISFVYAFLVPAPPRQSHTRGPRSTLVASLNVLHQVTSRQRSGSNQYSRWGNMIQPTASSPCSARVDVCTYKIQNIFPASPDLKALAHFSVSSKLKISNINISVKSG